MGHGRYQAERLLALQQQQKLAQTERIELEGAARKNSHEFWEVLVSSVKGEVDEFVRNYPAARYLRAEKVNENNLTVETTVQPILRIEIIRYPGAYVQAHIMRQQQRAVEHSETLKFNFTAYGFSAGESSYTAEELASSLCKLVYDFFEQVSGTGSPS